MPIDYGVEGDSDGAALDSADGEVDGDALAGAADAAADGAALAAVPAEGA